MVDALETRLLELTRRGRERALSLSARVGARGELIRSRDKEETLSAAHRERQALCQHAQVFLRTEIADMRTQAVSDIEEISTAALRQVYDESYALRFETHEDARREGGQANFRMEMRLRMVQKGQELLTGLEEECGGGVIDVVSSAQRFAILKRLDYPFLIMDETYKHLSKDEKILEVADFLRDVSTALGFQMIFATHSAEVFSRIADKVFLVAKGEDNIARVTLADPERVIEQAAQLAIACSDEDNEDW